MKKIMMAAALVIVSASVALACPKCPSSAAFAGYSSAQKKCECPCKKKCECTGQCQKDKKCPKCK